MKYSCEACGRQVEGTYDCYRATSGGIGAAGRIEIKITCPECDNQYWEGFDDCLKMVIISLNAHDDKALFTVHNFIRGLKEHLKRKSELYKKEI